MFLLFIFPKEFFPTSLSWASPAQTFQASLGGAFKKGDFDLGPFRPDGSRVAALAKVGQLQIAAKWANWHPMRKYPKKGTRFFVCLEMTDSNRVRMNFLAFSFVSLCLVSSCQKKKTQSPNLSKGLSSNSCSSCNCQFPTSVDDAGLPEPMKEIYESADVLHRRGPALGETGFVDFSFVSNPCIIAKIDSVL